jgi:DNA-binding IclR family transcriptional regulator
METSPVRSIDHALLALQSLAAAGGGGMRLATLASNLGLSRPTTHRCLAALRHRGFVTQDPETGAYLLGSAAVRLADVYLSEENLPVLLHPALLALSRSTDELVHLGVLSGTEVVYLAKVEPERPVRVWSAVGRRSAAATTALGRALLAYRGADRTALAGYARTGADRLDVDHLWAALEAARRRGFATEREENEAGISCVAVPLIRSGAAIAAVSVTAPAERMTPEHIQWLHAQMTEVLPPLLPEGLTLPAV